MPAGVTGSTAGSDPAGPGSNPGWATAAVSSVVDPQDHQDVELALDARAVTSCERAVFVERAGHLATVLELGVEAAARSQILRKYLEVTPPLLGRAVIQRPAVVHGVWHLQMY